MHPPRPDDCFVQLYTSGTTGFPKGAMLTHRGMLAHAAQRRWPDFELAPTARCRWRCRCSTSAGRATRCSRSAAGAQIVMLRMPDPAARAGHGRAERITHTFLVPALMAAMVPGPGAAERDYSSLQVISYGASPMPLPVMRASLELFPGGLHQVYGMTEACGVVSSLGPEDHADPAVAHRLVSAGKPITGVEIEIRDAATGEPAADRRAGRDLGAHRPADGRVLGQAGGDRRGDHRRTAGCARATAGTSTPTATSTSPTGSRT